MKTGQQVEDDVYALLRGSALEAMLGGGVYKHGLRPWGSAAEDAVVRFVHAHGLQVQAGTVSVSIYVPDIDPTGGGAHVRDVARLSELEAAALAWARSLTAERSDYRFRPAQAVRTEAEPDIRQHFVSLRLGFRRLAAT